MTDALSPFFRAGRRAILGVFAGAALADEPPSPALPQAPAASMQAYGAGNADCLEWTNSCAVCRRQASSQSDAPGIACSTPGIACQPGEIICKASLPKER